MIATKKSKRKNTHKKEKHKTQQVKCESGTNIELQRTAAQTLKQSQKTTAMLSLNEAHMYIILGRNESYI